MSTEGKVFHVSTDEEFQELMQKAKQNNVIVFMKFGATWCGPCKKIQPLYEKLAQSYPHFIFTSIDVNELEDVSETLNVGSLPTFSMVKGGHYRELFKGANEQLLVKVVQSENQAFNSR